MSNRNYKFIYIYILLNITNPIRFLIGFKEGDNLEELPLLCYFSILLLFGFGFSIYVGIFHNFATFKPNKPELVKKEKAIISLIYNILIGGIGTLLYGLSKITEKSNLV